MGRLWKFLLIVLVLAIAAFISFAYFGDLTPEQTTVSEPVELGTE